MVGVICMKEFSSDFAFPKLLDYPSQTISSKKTSAGRIRLQTLRRPQSHQFTQFDADFLRLFLINTKLELSFPAGVYVGGPMCGCGVRRPMPKMEDLAFSPDEAAPLLQALSTTRNLSLEPGVCSTLFEFPIPTDDGYILIRRPFFLGGWAFSLGVGSSRFAPQFQSGYEEYHHTEHFCWASIRTQEIITTPDGRHGISLHGMPDHRLYCWRLADEMWVQKRDALNRGSFRRKT